jgi:2'-5' RNA ligase
MRLFIAVLPDKPTRQALERTQDAIAPVLERGRRTAPANLHLTLAFLGELEEDGARQAAEALEAAAAEQEPFSLSLGACGAFSRRRGRDLVVWRGVASDEGLGQLRRLHARLSAELESAGLPVPGRLVPHFTLFRNARLPKTKASDAAGSPTEALAGIEAPPACLAVREAHMMLSHHPDGGPLTYTSIRAVPLGAGPKA